MNASKFDLPKHPLLRATKCPVCSTEFDTIPLRRGATPDDPHRVMEQHVCPNGHVYVTEIGGHEMVADW
jgi:hypothetical protein